MVQVAAPRGGSGRGGLVRWALPAIGAAFAAAATTLPLPGHVAFLLLLGAAIAFWVSDLLPPGAVSLGLLAAWVLAGIASPAQAAAGFGSENWVFVVALLGLAAAIARSGLLFRVGLMLVRRMPEGLF